MKNLSNSQYGLKKILLSVSVMTINILVTSNSRSAPVTFNTALPVAKGEFVFREQFIMNQSAIDASIADRDFRAWSAVSVLGYGITGKLAIFGVLPYVNKQFDVSVSGQRQNSSADGLGDVGLFTRYTLYQRDWRGRTLRIAPFTGLKAPSGRDDKQDSLGRLPPGVQTGSASWDVFGGVVASYQTLDYEIDSQISYRGNGRSSRFAAGDETRFDASLQYRLWPTTLDVGVPGFLYGVIESNLVFKEKNRIGGRSDSDSGGTRWFLTPGLQYVTRRWVFETVVQLPVVQELNGTALENEYIVRSGFRVNF